MRCPKCGYISFDREDACFRCNADLTEVSSILSGTAVRVQEPFFLASVLRQRGERDASEELEFDLAEAMPESSMEIELAEDEGIPMVDLPSFEKHQEVEEEEEVGSLSDIHGTINFSFGEESASEEKTTESVEEAPEFDFVLDEEGEEVAEQFGEMGSELEEKSEVDVLQTEEALPELEFEIDAESEESLELDSGFPDIDLEDLVEEPVVERSGTSEKGSGLDLDIIDVNLEEDEPPEGEMVFNLEDIDMSDLIIDSPKKGGDQAGRPEELALDLEDFLSSSKSEKNTGIPMDLTMENMDFLGDSEEDMDKKLVQLPDIEL